MIVAGWAFGIRHRSGFLEVFVPDHRVSEEVEEAVVV